MDSDEFRAILSRSRVGIWELIGAAIKVASSDYGDELRRRRDAIVESLYTPAAELCRSCNGDIHNDAVHDEHYSLRNNKDYNNSDDININDNSNNILNDDKIKSSNEDYSGGEEEEELDPFGALFDDDDEQTKILSIKDQLEDPNQSEDTVMELLQNLADMDITFQALKETDIGRHVNRLRKYPSNEVRELVKQLVRKWKETVDDWVKVNPPQENSNLMADGDSPQHNIPKNQQNGHHEVLDFGYSPNPRNGSSSAERHYVERETKPRPPQSAPRREAPAPSRPPQSVPKSAPAPPNRAQRAPVVDDERLNSARRRLQENYEEAQNAKKQRKIQVMDIHDIPKPKNSFFSKNRGGFKGRR